MSDDQKIFIVDHDSSARQGLVRLLAKAGYQVDGFDSLEACLPSLAGKLAGCLILDATTLGPSNGLSFKALRNLRDMPPVIMIAADDDPESRQQAHGLKAEAFFRKPVDGAALLDCIRWSLR
jgi:FixJ family two-component response regulator